MGYIPRAKETEKPQTGKEKEANGPVPVKEQSLDILPKQVDSSSKNYGG